MTRIPLLPFDQFNTVSKMAKIDCPVLVIHGKHDGLISPWHGKTLFEKAGEPKHSLWVEGAGHNNLFETARGKYEQALQDFSKLVDGL
jgi:hypothetical protein